jgi:hypothetical protein
MRKHIFISVFLCLTTWIIAQSKLESGLYLKSGIAHDYKFQLNKVLTNLETNKISPIAFSTSFGLHLDYRNVVYSLDGGIGAMSNKQTRTTNLSANLSAGYQLFLPKENSLIFSGVLTYQYYSVYSSHSKGILDMETNMLTTTQFSLQLHQFMAGAKIAWYNEETSIGIGYDAGCIPTTWVSEVVKISNNYKERIDRIYLYIAYDIRKF